MGILQWRFHSGLAPILTLLGWECVRGLLRVCMCVWERGLVVCVCVLRNELNCTLQMLGGCSRYCLSLLFSLFYFAFPSFYVAMLLFQKTLSNSHDSPFTHTCAGRVTLVSLLDGVMQKA